MGRALRWLAFFVIGEALVAVFLFSVIPLVYAGTYLSALWEAGFDTFRARIAYEIRSDGMFDVPEMAILIALIPGVIGGFLVARESLRHPGWRFWRW